MKPRILLAAPLLAVLPLAIPQARAAVPEAAPVTALDHALISTMKGASAHQSFMARYDALKPVVERSFDLPAILQVSAGPLWPQIPPAQQSELEKLFREFTVATYVSSFSGYGGQHFVTLSGARAIGAKRIVATDLVSPTGKKTRLSYVMAPTKGTWKITDVLFEGTISKVAMQRSEFSGMIAPGNAENLIASLKHKVAALSGGALKG